MIKDFITQDQYKRTIRLLGRVRREYDINTYLVIKGILTVGIMTEHYQKLYPHLEKWISYESLLSRNERMVGQKYQASSIITMNGLGHRGGSFFGVRNEIIRHEPYTHVMDASDEYWRKEIESNDDYF
jgi:hypothetical protein